MPDTLYLNAFNEAKYNVFLLYPYLIQFLNIFSLFFSVLRAFFMGMLDRYTFTFHFHALEKKMATYSSILAWRIPPGTGEPRGLPSMGSHRVGHD